MTEEQIRASFPDATEIEIEPLGDAAASLPMGPWREESLAASWAAGPVRYSMQRNGGGCWCGYVHLPAGHQWFGTEYDAPWEVHGGVTYGKLDRDGRWTLGFDCAHYSDMMPSATPRRGTYRDELFVLQELAAQHAEVLAGVSLLGLVAQTCTEAG